MSLTSDIAAYLRRVGVVDDAVIRVSIGIQSKQHDGFNGTLVAIEPLPGIQAETHGNENRGLGFRLLVRTGQHKLTDCESAFMSVFDLLQDQDAAVNATPGLTHSYRMIRSDQDGPLVSYDKMDRPHLTAVFRCVVDK